LPKIEVNKQIFAFTKY